MITERRKGALPDAFKNTPWTILPPEDGEYTAQLSSIYLERRANSQTIFVIADLETAQKVSLTTRWVLVGRCGKVNEVGVKRFRQAMKTLGYVETAEEHFNEETLDRIFREINASKTWLKIRITSRGDWLNVNFQRLIDRFAL